MLMGNGKKPKSNGVKQHDFFNRTGPIKINQKDHHHVDDVLNVTDINDEEPQRRQAKQDLQNHFLYGHMRNQGPFGPPMETKQRKSNSQKPHHLLDS